MRYRESIQAQLQERYQRLYKANWQAYRYEAGYLIEFIRSTPALKFLAESIERAVPELNPEQWAAENFGWQRVDLPPTEEGRAKLAWHLLQRWSTEPQGASLFGHNLDHNADAPEGARLATEQIVEPLIEYFQRHLGESSNVLYLLERYVRRLEWFEKQHLWDRYEADKAHGEAIYDADLREFLFDQGIDYPFSQPRSSSGEADVVAELASDDPLVCEVKLFDGAHYGKAYVGKGFRQAVQYANDYSKSTAYLVVINLSDKQLELPTDGQPTEWPARVEAQGVTVFLIRVRARPQPSASKQPKPATIVIAKSDLRGDEAPANPGP
jgi:hypothetical protein